MRNTINDYNLVLCLRNTCKWASCSPKKKYYNNGMACFTTSRYGNIKYATNLLMLYCSIAASDCFTVKFYVFFKGLVQQGSFVGVAIV